MRPIALPFALVVSLFLASPGVSFANEPAAEGVEEQEQARDQTHQEDMEQLRIHLRKRLKLAQNDVDAMEPGLKRYFRLRGDQAHVRTMLQAGVDNGCVGVCLTEMVQSMNRAMVMGMQDQEAGAMVVECLQDRIRDRDRTGANWSDQDLRDGIHDRVQDRLRIWSHERAREMDREWQRELERERQREMERGAERSMGMGGHGGSR